FGCDNREAFSSLRHSLSLGALPIEDARCPPSIEVISASCERHPHSKEGHSPQKRKKRKSLHRRFEDPKQATIRQHYYPEGGWGYVVLLVGTLVQMLSHGLQLSFGLFLIFIIEKWRLSMDFALWKFGKKNIF
ncbi:Uncharacterized protein FKW44_012926, partial [Caligus rogercresseyi]